VATLADVLEAIHRTDELYRTLRAVGRSDGELWRLWVERPDRQRVERVDPLEFKVQVGGRWWEYSAAEDGWTSDGEAPSFVAEWPLERLLDPRPLLAAVISVLGTSTHANRPAVAVHVNRRKDDNDADDNGADEWYAAYGEDFDAVIDLATGIVVSVGGDELTELHVDEAVPSSLFEVPTGDGSGAVRIEPPEPRVVATLAEAARSAGFRVLVPAALPEGAVAGSYVLAPAGRPPSLSVRYEVAPGPRAIVQVRQHPHAPYEDDPAPPWQPSGSEGVWVRDGPGFMTEVLVRRSGTTAFLQTDLNQQAAVQVGASMEPVP